MVEGWRPGVAQRLGVGPDDVRAVNPSVVYCSLSGFGGTGPLVHAPGHDVNYQARAGALAPDGGEPAPSPSPRLPFADLAGGLAAAFAICAAWIGRQRTGQGETIDVSMTDVLASWTNVVGGGPLQGVRGPVRGLPAYGTFPVADGYVALGVIVEQHFWDATCSALGLDDLVGIGVPEQVERGDEVRTRITAALRDPHPRRGGRGAARGGCAHLAGALARRGRGRRSPPGTRHRRRGARRPCLRAPRDVPVPPARPPGPSPAADQDAGEGFSGRG